jgi:hypothetical protein
MDFSPETFAAAGGGRPHFFSGILSADGIPAQWPETIFRESLGMPRNA